MTKHIHVHISPRARVGDAGDFDESKVKRDDGGKFSASASAHAGKEAEHNAAWKKLGAPHDKSGSHMIAEGLHARAKEHYTHAAAAAKEGRHDDADMHAKLGKHWASEADNVERNGAAGSPPTHPAGHASGPDKPVSVPTAGSGKEKTFAIPKPPAGTPGGPVKGRGPVDLGNQKPAASSSAYRARMYAETANPRYLDPPNFGPGSGKTKAVVTNPTGGNVAESTQAIARLLANRTGAPKEEPPASTVRGWRATTEPSQFGGHRPVVARLNGDPVHISGDSFDTPAQAHAYAEHLALHPGVVERGARPPKQASDFPGYRKQQGFK